MVTQKQAAGYDVGDWVVDGNGLISRVVDMHEDLIEGGWVTTVLPVGADKDKSYPTAALRKIRPGDRRKSLAANGPTYEVTHIDANGQTVVTKDIGGMTPGKERTWSMDDFVMSTCGCGQDWY